MTEIQRPVLVATDLSARSDRAVDRATLLAKEWGSPLIVVHALEPGSPFAADPGKAVQAIRCVLPDPAADAEIVPAIGSAPATIVNAAISANCSLIITGVARFNDIGDFLIGTAVDHVVRNSPVPVLVVKQRPRGPYRSVLVATDYSSCSRLALITAASLFPDARIHVVHAFHVPYEGWLTSDEVRREMTRSEQEKLDHFLQNPAIPADLRGRVEAQIRDGEPAAVLMDSADDLDADLIVLGTNGANGFIPAIVGSMAESLLRSGRRDTLMVREMV